MDKYTENYCEYPTAPAWLVCGNNLTTNEEEYCREHSKEFDGKLICRIHRQRYLMEKAQKAIDDLHKAEKSGKYKDAYGSVKDWQGL